MRALRILAIVVVGYVGLVVVFESLIGFLQPANESTLVITTYDAQGAPHERVVSRLESDGRLYVAANHWPRAWYRRALAKPDVEAKIGDEERAYRAVPVEGAEHDRVNREHAVPIPFRFMMGFPPRRLLRLDPRP